MNRHPGEPQLTNKPCMNGRLERKTQSYCDENRLDGWTDGATDRQSEANIPHNKVIIKYDNTGIWLAWARYQQSSAWD